MDAKTYEEYMAENDAAGEYHMGYRIDYGLMEYPSRFARAWAGPVMNTEYAARCLAEPHATWLRQAEALSEAVRAARKAELSKWRFASVNGKLATAMATVRHPHDESAAYAEHARNVEGPFQAFDAARLARRESEARLARHLAACPTETP